MNLEPAEVLEKLRKAMLKSEKSLSRLAKASGLTKNTVEKVRSGKANDIQLNTFLALCDGAGVLPVEIFSGRMGNGLSGEELALLTTFRRLKKDDNRKAILYTLKTFTEN